MCVCGGKRWHWPEDSVPGGEGEGEGGGVRVSAGTGTSARTAVAGHGRPPGRPNRHGRPPGWRIRALRGGEMLREEVSALALVPAAPWL